MFITRDSVNDSEYKYYSTVREKVGVYNYIYKFQHFWLSAEVGTVIKKTIDVCQHLAGEYQLCVSVH